LFNQPDASWLSWEELYVTGSSGEAVPTRFAGTLLFEDLSVIGSVGFFQDLREIKQLQQDLVRSERLAAIGQTVAGIAHCIKNILSGLKGGTYVVNTALDKNDLDTLKKGWSIIQNNIGRISDLALDLLTYSKEREPEYESCSPNAIVEEVCRLMDERAREHGIELNRELDTAIGTKFMDPKAIHRSLLNLVSNAIDACIEDQKTKEKTILVKTSLLMDNRVHFEVADNGPGMSADVQEKLFASFFSTKGDQGTGLGLLVTQKLVQEHNGNLAFFSEEGKGSVFTITLPEGTLEQG
jgi:signal transduction histidine kinase